MMVQQTLPRKNYLGVLLNEYFHCEFYDLNKDGNLDLIIGGHEWKSFASKNAQLGGIYENYILWGDGKANFSFSNSTKLPFLNLWELLQT